MRDHFALGKKILLFIYERKATVRPLSETYFDYVYFSIKGRDDIQRRGIRFLLDRTSSDNSSVVYPFDFRTKTYVKPKKTERKELLIYHVGQGY